MKKFLALLLCLLLLTALAACKDSASETDAPSDAPAATSDSSVTDTTVPSTEEAHKHKHVSYKGLVDASYTIDDVAAVEGREPDFSVDQSGTTIYIYNNVTLDALTFTQVQFTFSDTGNRISCTYTADSGLDAVLEEYKNAMTDLYGTPAEGMGSYPSYTWRDGHTANFVMLTQLNDTTVQLAFYLCEGAQ